MLAPPTCQFLFFLASLLLAIGLAWRRGVPPLGVAMASSFTAATWFEWTAGGVPVSVRLVTAIAGLLWVCALRPRRLIDVWLATDVIIILIVVWASLVDIRSGGPAMMTVLRAYGEWMIPYLAGRQMIVHRDELLQLAPFFSLAAAVVGILCLFESFTGQNVYELLAPRDDRVDLTASQRWFSLWRAHGPTRHPIFCGLSLLTMTPWAVTWVATARSIASPAARAAAGISLTLIISGIGATLSRGPMLGVIIAAAVAAAILFRPVRYGLPVPVLIAVMLIWFNADVVARWIDRDIPQAERATIVQIDNEAVIFNGTRNRLLIFRVYGPLVVEGGWFGYGTEASAGFPPRGLLGLPSDPLTRRRLAIIDNSYLNVGLRFGWVGLGLFVSLMVAAFWSTASLTATADTYLHSIGRLPVAWLAGTVAAVAVSILTVYWDYDHGFWILFLVGTTAGWCGAAQRHRRGAILGDA